MYELAMGGMVYITGVGFLQTWRRHSFLLMLYGIASYLLEPSSTTVQYASTFLVPSYPSHLQTYPSLQPVD